MNFAKRLGRTSRRVFFVLLTAGSQDRLSGVQKPRTERSRRLKKRGPWADPFNGLSYRE